MRVLLAHNYYRSGAPSGEDAVFYNECELLRARGHEVTIFTRNNDEIDESSLPKRVRLALNIRGHSGQSRSDQISPTFTTPFL